MAQGGLGAGAGAPHPDDISDDDAVEPLTPIPQNGQYKLTDRGIQTVYLFVVRRYKHKICCAERPPRADYLTWCTNQTPFLNLKGLKWYYQNFTQIQIRVNAMLYLGEHEMPHNQPSLQFISAAEYGEYFWRYARKQLGYHLFIIRRAFIQGVLTYIEDPRAKDPYTTDPPFYRTADITPINSIYPVLRTELNPSSTIDTYANRCTTRTQLVGPYDFGRIIIYSYKLAIGLDFRYMDPQNYSQGNRYYARHTQYEIPVPEKGEAPIRAGNVYEMTEHFLDDLSSATYLTQSENRCAFYVCAGAKLVVVDDCHADKNDESHNRSFIQAGGVVAFQHPFGIFKPGLKMSKTSDIFETLKEYIIKRVINGDLWKDKLNIENPVIFLGANESEYDSIAWVVSLQRNHLDRMNPELSRAVLQIPEGGHIVAIENWADGIAEIQARHRYERLFEGSVSLRDYPADKYSDSLFEAPSTPFLCKILGLICLPQYKDRSFSCDVKKGVLKDFIPYVRKVSETLPKQYNFRYCTEINWNRVMTEPPPPPPLFPTLEYMMGKRCYFPTRESGLVYKITTEDEIQIHFRMVARPAYQSNTSCHIYGIDRNHVKTLSEYPMQKLMLPNHAIWGMSGLECRVGTDGWIYQKKESQEEDQWIAKYKSQYYYSTPRLPWYNMNF